MKHIIVTLIALSSPILAQSALKTPLSNQTVPPTEETLPFNPDDYSCEVLETLQGFKWKEEGVNQKITMALTSCPSDVRVACVIDSKGKTKEPCDKKRG